VTFPHAGPRELRLDRPTSPHEVGRAPADAWRIDRLGSACNSRFVAAEIEALLALYIGRYAKGNLQGVASLCVTPFFAIRKGELIVMPDRGAVLSHFGAAIDAYRRAADVRTWAAREINTLQLGEYSAFVTVHWNAFDANEQVVRDTWTSYQLLTTPDGWRFLSYTNHF
jgi:hypothetical protein